MESNKPSYAAILSRDKEENTPRPANVHVNDWVRRPRSAPINPDDIETRTRQRGTPEDGDGKHLQHIYNKELRRQRDALVLDGARLRNPALRLLETEKILQVPGPSKEDRRVRKEAKWHKHQLDEIEKQIEKYERKLEEVQNLRSSLGCLLYTSPSPRDRQKSRMPSSA